MKREADAEGHGQPVVQDETVQGSLGRSAVWLFSHLLWLYPGQFRARFSEEMVDVFTLAVHDAEQQGNLSLSRLLFGELTELPVTLIAEQIYERKKGSMTPLKLDTWQEIQLARWIARGLSLLMVGFVVSVAAFNEDFLTEITAPTVILTTLSLLALSAWRWERAGGLLTMGLAPLLLLSILLQHSSGPGLIPPFWFLVLLAAGGTLSFVIVGWLFVSVAQHTETSKVESETHSRAGSSTGRLRNSLVVVALGIAALLFFAVPTVVPVQRRLEPLSDQFADVEQIIGALRAQNAVVGVSNLPARRPFLSVGGRELIVNGKSVEVYMYSDTSSATVDASRIYYDDDAPAWNQAAWTDTPHFYQASNVILIYEGSSEEMLSLLQRAFGEPFAEG